MEKALLNLEEFRDVPGPRLLRTADDLAAVRCLEMPRLSSIVVEKRERRDNTVLFVSGLPDLTRLVPHEKHARRNIASSNSEAE